MAANKADLLGEEKVSELEAREFAFQIGAIFRLTSASLAYGIEDLFKIIGSKLIERYFIEENDSKYGLKKKYKFDSILISKWKNF